MDVEFPVTVSFDVCEIIDHIDLDQLGRKIDHADVASYIDLEEVANNIATYDVAKHVNMNDLADEFEVSDIAQCFDAREIAEEICYEDLATYIRGADIAPHIDVNDLGSPMPTGRDMFRHMTDAICAVADCLGSDDAGKRAEGLASAAGFLAAMNRLNTCMIAIMQDRKPQPQPEVYTDPLVERLASGTLTAESC